MGQVLYSQLDVGSSRECAVASAFAFRIRGFVVTFFLLVGVARSRTGMSM
jgi:hypothetical protein